MNKQYYRLCLEEYSTPSFTSFGKYYFGTLEMIDAFIQSLKEDLPGIDCGSCGAPSCTAFAEDCVKGESTVDQCPILAVYKAKENI